MGLVEPVRSSRERGRRSLPVVCGEGRISRPVPAVYLVDREGIIRFAHWNRDYKKRLDSNELLDAARRAAPETRKAD